MGGKAGLLNDIARNIWLLCKEREIWIPATHIPGIMNEADFSYRNFNKNHEWKLDKSVLLKEVECFGLPEIDMFASRLNKQISRFVSWKPDPDAEAVDAFAVN